MAQSDSEGSLYEPEQSPAPIPRPHLARAARDASSALDFSLDPSASAATSALPTGVNTSTAGTPAGSEGGDDQGDDSARVTTAEATPDPQPQPVKRSRALNFLKKKEPKTSIVGSGLATVAPWEKETPADHPPGHLSYAASIPPRRPSRASRTRSRTTRSCCQMTRAARPRLTTSATSSAVRPLPAVARSFPVDALTRPHTHHVADRQWKVHTFTSPLRPNPNRVYILSIDAARAAGFRDSLYFFRRNPMIHKLTCNQEEKDRLIELGRLSGNLKSRAVTMVAARNVFKVMGATFLQSA